VIIVFGSINLDLVARVPRMPRPGETLSGTAFAMFPGGKGANQALAARRAGARVAMHGAVGRDAFADAALASLAAAGVVLDGVVRVDAPTGVALIHVDARGENAITVVPGANGHANAASVPATALSSAATLLMQLEVPLAEVSALAMAAKAARVMLNAAPAQPLPAALLDLLDVLIVNEHEAAAIGSALGLPAAVEAFAVALWQRHGCATVVTLGAAGALAVTGDGIYRVPTPPTEVIDTTGAGDAFCGALAAALDRGSGWSRALAEAIAAGSLTCRSAGAQPALPLQPEIAGLADAIERSGGVARRDPLR
jgi:ribokinase